MSDYQPPIAKLLEYGECHFNQDWLNYVEELQLEEQHIPELIKMATDENLNHAHPESQEVWSPVHAWRALGQLKALEALEPLLELLDREPDDDWISIDFPHLCPRLGKECTPLLETFLADSSRDVFARITVADTLKTVAEQYPETLESTVATLVGELEKFRENDPGLNGFLIGALVDLQATETIKTIRRAFQADRVDSFVIGDWEDVQVELGLKTRRKIQEQPVSDLEDFTSLLPEQPEMNQTKVNKGFGNTQKKKSRNRKKKK